MGATTKTSDQGHLRGRAGLSDANMVVITPGADEMIFEANPAAFTASASAQAGERFMKVSSEINMTG